MSQPKQRQPKKRFPVKKGIKLDRVNPIDFNSLNLIYSCEQCSFHDPESTVCTMGFFSKKHEKEAQLKTYNLTGMMGFCRYQEID